jgi:hypothetical protein
LNLTKANVKYTLTRNGDNYTLQLTTPHLLKNLRVAVGDDATIIFSDNYFDLIPGEMKTITFKSEKVLFSSDFTFLSINDMTE